MLREHMKFAFKLRSVQTFLASLSVIVLLAGCSTPSRDVSHYPANAAAALPGKGPLQTWTGFTNIWAQRHAAWRRDTTNHTGAVVFLGDSITEGWKSLARDFPDFKVVNRGIGGDTTRGVLYRLNTDVIALKPSAVVLLIGINDIGLNANPQDVADNIKAIVLELKRSNPHMPIIVCKVMPSSTKQHRSADKIEQLNALVDEIVKSDPQCIRCDTWSIYADENGECKKNEFPDLLHPNAIGYAKWANALKPIFAQLNLEAAKAR
jgi:lysophospholipase L1-like esterase